MKILFINTLDQKGGAAIMMNDLKKDLENRGHDVSVFVGFKQTNDKNVFQIPRYKGQAVVNRLMANDLSFSLSNSILKTKEYKEAEIVHFHNIHSSFFNIETLKKISKEKPSLWTLHDLWPITWGCTTSLGCGLNKPQKFFKLFGDNRNNLLRKKEKIYKETNFPVISPSMWLKNQVEKSILKDHESILIRNGVDTDIFNTNKKSYAKKEIGLDPNKKVVMFIANQGHKNKLKGSDFFFEIAKNFKQNDTTFLLIGGQESELDNIKSVGYVDDRNKLSLYYQASDVFLYPSLSDNCPLVILESMACGTPVVTFNTDGIPEMIEQGKTGFIVEKGNTNNLIEKTKEILNLNDEKIKEFFSSCIENIEKKYSLKKMTDEYLSIYKRLLNSKQ